MAVSAEMGGPTEGAHQGLGESVVVDGTEGGNLTSFINHSCSPNFYMQDMVHGHVVFIALFARRAISRDEDLTYDYRMIRDVEGRLLCNCGSASCCAFIN